MDYFVLDAYGVIENVIVCDDPAFVAEIGAVPAVAGQGIGDTYSPPPTDTERIRADIDYLAAMLGVKL